MHSVQLFPFLYFNQNFYKEANKNTMATSYSLPSDTPLIKQVKLNSTVTSNVSPLASYHTDVVRVKLQCSYLIPLFECISCLAQVKYKEAYEMTKAKCYSLHPEGVNFVNCRKAHKICNEVRSLGRG